MNAEERVDSITPSRARAPRQDRSRDTLGRIVAAARALMDGRDDQTISVQEICRHARVSPSSFYARFATKEDLLFAVHDAHRAERLAHLTRYERSVDWQGTSLHEVVRGCLRLYLEDRRRLAPFLRSLMSVELHHPDFAAKRAEVDAAGVEFITARLLARLGTEDPELARRIEFAIRVVCTAAQEATRSPGLHAERMGLSDDELVDRLAEMFCRYVGLVDAADPLTRSADPSGCP